MPSTKSNIYILTGPVHTGKSCALTELAQEFSKLDKTVRGLLNPSIDGQKWFLDFESGDRFTMEESEQKDSIKVGRFIFSAKAFERARKVIHASSQLRSELFIIDEIGKLEMKGDGLEPAISFALKAIEDSEIKNIILVVRDYLVEDAITHFGLEAAQIITKEDLKIDRWLS